MLGSASELRDGVEGAMARGEPFAMVIVVGHEAARSEVQYAAGPIFSKLAVEGHGLSTSTVPKGSLQEGRQTELRGRSLEVFQTDYRYNRVLEC
jgi:hypothetical protein